MRRVVRVAVLLAGAALAAWAVSGKRAELEGATAYFRNMRWEWLAAGVAAEVASLVAFAALQRRLLCGGGDVPVGMVPLTALSFAGYAIQNSLPGGAAWAAVFAYRQYRIRGADEVLATWVLVAVSVLSAAGLATIVVVGAVVAGQVGATWDAVAVAAAVLVAAAGVVVLVRRTRTVPTIAATAVRLAQRVIHRPEGQPDEVVSAAWRRFRAVTPGRDDWVAGYGFGLANWLWDSVCLGTAFVAVHAPVPWRGLLLAYGAAQLVANLPITPGGLGVVEGSLTIALVAYGGREASTVAAVLIYRIISFWLMLVIGWGGVGWLTYVARRYDAVEGAAP